MSVAGHIVITGPMGVGKTTTANAVAAELGLPYRDSDSDIEARTGMTGREIAEREGVPFLHELEAEVLLDALEAVDASVISAAGSVVERSECRAALNDAATVVLLEIDLATLLDRMSTGSHRRPIDSGEIEKLLERRAAWFGDVADLSLDATEPTSQLVAKIVSAVEANSQDGST
ncbi:MAG: shikimate kinase [Acidimicrobiales bacterium]